MEFVQTFTMGNVSHRRGESLLLVCFANSRKNPGRCVAGKLVDGARVGDWVRPVSGLEHGAIKDDGQNPKLLEIVSIRMQQPAPQGNQRENWRIVDDARWDSHGEIRRLRLPEFLDDVEGPLWVNGHSSQFGENDRIPEEVAKTLKSSLVLIQPKNLGVRIVTEFHGRRRVRALFTLNGHSYTLSVTDPQQEMFFLTQTQDSFDLSGLNIFICVSIGEAYEGYCYKLAASIIKGDAK
jgi:hypothetical protein